MLLHTDNLVHQSPVFIPAQKMEKNQLLPEELHAVFSPIIIDHFMQQI